MSDIITLTTDFGTSDAYVASMKGVILSLNPKAQIVDICHNIGPQSVSQAAFVLDTAYLLFPKKTIHIVEVDPGVGTERKAIILRTPTADFVAPDNGVLSYVIERFCDEKTEEEGVTRAKLNREAEAVTITNERFLRMPVSNTFHGRDIFAPVAAALSLGFPPVQFGQRLASLEFVPPSRPAKRPGGALVGHIVYIDGFGNLITDVNREDLPESKELTFGLGSHTIDGLRETYARASGLLAIIGSGGRLEIACNGGSAKSMMEARVGDEVTIKPS